MKWRRNKGIEIGSFFSLVSSINFIEGLHGCQAIFIRERKEGEILVTRIWEMKWGREFVLILSYLRSSLTMSVSCPLFLLGIFFLKIKSREDGI